LSWSGSCGGSSVAVLLGIEPLALLSLEAAIRGQPQLVPAFCAGRGYIHGPHDGLGRTYDSVAIYSKKRGD
jgi:hypothetical protein